MRYTIEQVATLMGACLVASRYENKECSVGFLLTDSRSLCFPEETLFFALQSNRNDGHRYINSLYKRGVRNFVVERLPEEVDGYSQANFLMVTDTRRALQQLAERHREKFHVPVVGITGSNGKTMVKEWLYQLLTSDLSPLTSPHITRSPRSYNSQIGVPLSVWLMDEQTTLGIFEAGISERGEMQALRDIIQPTIGIITNIGDAHQENFASKDEICEEKLKLFRDAEVVFYPADDPVIARHIGSLRARTIAYRPWEGQLPFISSAARQNAGACVAVARYLGMDDAAVAEAVNRLEPVAMRLEVKEGQHGCTLINDSYNSDLKSLDIALDFMQRRWGYEEKQMSELQNNTLILSDIQQSGLPPEELYRTVAELLHQRGITKFIGIGPDLCSQKEVFSRPPVPSLLRTPDNFTCAFFETVDEFVHSDLFSSLHDEVILLKGARQFGFDQITDLLVQKVHETTLEVNLGAVVKNLNYYRSKMRAGTKLVCMIKADAYGAGAVEIAKTLQEHGVDYLAVAVADEGAELRRAGITSNIMVMNPEMSSFKTLFDYDLEPEVYSFRLLDALIAAAEREGITGWPVHIKIDTGMHRLGFNAFDNCTISPFNNSNSDNSQIVKSSNSEISELISRLRSQTAVIPRSVFSHFVGSDSDDFDAFSQRQFEIFDHASRQLQAAFSHKILRHICNSAGIEHFPERQLDMCRLGIGLYGVDPRPTPAASHLAPRTSHLAQRKEGSLVTISTLRTTILQLRHVQAGDSVGYSRRTVLDRDSVIAAIPIGYADGLNRMLGNRHGYCLVNGHRADYVGNICMDVAMIDVTGIDCREGDSVEIFGPNLPVSVLSDIIGTIPYEVLTAVSNRVKRIYFQD